MSFCNVCVFNHPTCGCVRDVFADDACLDEVWENNLKSNTTNGDVIKAMFPNIEVEEGNGIVEMSIGSFVNSFRKDLWNAPYKEG